MIGYIFAPLSFFFAGILVSIMAVRKIECATNPSFWDYLALACAIFSGLFFMGLITY